MTVHGVDPETVWDLSRDYENLASCSSHIQDATERTPGASWEARLTSRIGRFSISAPIQVAIENEKYLEAIVIRLTGEDRAVGTRLSADVVGDLDKGDSWVEVRMHGAYEVTGKVANLGSALVKSQAKKMIDEFWANLAAEMKRLGATRVDVEWPFEEGT